MRMRRVTAFINKRRMGEYVKFNVQFNVIDVLGPTSTVALRSLTAGTAGLVALAGPRRACLLSRTVMDIHSRLV